MIPVSTTTIDIYANDAKPFEQAQPRLLASGIRATFDVPVGNEQSDQRSQDTATVYADIVDFDVPQSGYVVDNNTGHQWDIISIHKYVSDGFLSQLDHMQIGVQMITGSISSSFR